MRTTLILHPLRPLIQLIGTQQSAGRIGPARQR
jgi:hypothetical protein